MTCAVCGTSVETITHFFYEGISPLSRDRGQRPVREWTIEAPLYFKSNDDNTAMVEGYCSVACAVAAALTRKS
jgi:hypothetical protein